MRSSEIEFREKLISILDSDFGGRMEYPRACIEEIIFSKIGELKGKVEVLEKIAFKSVL